LNAGELTVKDVAVTFPAKPNGFTPPVAGVTVMLFQLDAARAQPPVPVLVTSRSLNVCTTAPIWLLKPLPDITNVDVPGLKVKFAVLKKFNARPVLVSVTVLDPRVRVFVPMLITRLGPVTL
jgi:hypothetical protein